jgi:hypothetical protein
MLRIVGLLGLALALGACAPGLVSGEPWARTVFAPSDTARLRACELGFRSGQAKEFSDDSPGLIDFGGNTGNLRLYSAVGGTFLYCKLFGLIGRPPESFPRFPTFFFIEKPTSTLESYELTLELRADNGDIIETLKYLEKYEDEDKDFGFRALNIGPRTLPYLDRASTILISLKTGDKTQQFTLRPGAGQGLF